MTFRSTGQAAPAEGDMTAVDLDGSKVAVARVDGRLYAFDDVCTHQQCSLSGGELDGATVVCPCHLGQFDLATGAVLAGPPPAPLRTWSVQAVDDVVELAT
jgi:nitrite reductase/ring-hydroxylating ferredoxin subunit